MRSYWPLPIAFILLIGCSAPAYHPSNDLLTPAQRDQLITTARSYLGTPYKYGGQSVDGFDCSGLIRTVFGEAVGVKLPRTVRGIYKATVEVSPGSVFPGDIVFFRINGGDIDHVGLILDQHRFLHAAESSGVVISNFDDDYYRHLIFCVRRAN